MFDKPMSYDCLKHMLQYLEANKRIELNTRCPSIRAAEKAVPLRINELYLCGSGVCINQKSYRIGIYRKYHAGKVPEAIVKANDGGGVCHEVDRFGMKDKSDEKTVTPGDVVFKNTSSWQNSAMSVHGTRPEIELEFIQDEIQSCEENLAAKREGRLRDDDYLSRILQLMPIEDIESKLEEARAILFAWECRRDNVTPPYEHFIVMSITNREEKFIKGYMYNKTYREAVKSLTTVIFGGRKFPVHVKNVEFFENSIIRLPLGIKFRFENYKDMTTTVGASLDAFRPVLHESSFPLKLIQLHFLQPADAGHPTVSEAEALKLTFHHSARISLLPNLQNKKLIFNANPTRENLRYVINHLKLRSVGTDYILFSKSHKFSDLTLTLQDQFGEEALNVQTILIKVKSGNVQIRLCYEESPTFAPDQEWALQLSVEEVEH